MTTELFSQLAGAVATAIRESHGPRLSNEQALFYVTNLRDLLDSRGIDGDANAILREALHRAGAEVLSAAERERTAREVARLAREGVAA